MQARIAEPLELGSFSVPASPDELTSEAIAGTSPSGREQAAWTGSGLAPAGGIRSDVEDMGRLTAALLDGSAPGSAALEPVADMKAGRRIGAGWMISDNDGQLVT